MTLKIVRGRNTQSCDFHLSLRNDQSMRTLPVCQIGNGAALSWYFPLSATNIICIHAFTFAVLVVIDM